MDAKDPLEVFWRRRPEVVAAVDTGTSLRLGRFSARVLSVSAKVCTGKQSANRLQRVREALKKPLQIVCVSVCKIYSTNMF